MAYADDQCYLDLRRLTRGRKSSPLTDPLGTTNDPVTHSIG